MREDIKERIEICSIGKVPDNYKKSNVGIIPEDWNEMDFYQCATIQSGLIDPKIQPYSYMRHIGPENIEKDTGRIVNVVRAKEQGLISGKFLFDENCIIYSKVRPNLNKVCMPNYEGICSADCYVIHNKENIIKEFLHCYMLSDFFKKQAVACSMRTKMPKINQEELSTIKIIVPKPLEQKRIVEIIQAVDQKNKLNEKLLIEKQKQKKWIAQLLLTGRVRVPGFSKEWKKVRMSEIFKERKEYAVKDAGYEHVTLSKDGIFPKCERYDREHLVTNVNKNYKVTRSGDICYNPANLKFGVICKNRYEDAIFSPIYVTLETRSGYDSEFAAQFVSRQDFINAVRKYEEGTVYERMAVKAEDFMKYDAYVPQFDEQKAISSILSKMDNEILLIEKKVELVRQEKRALMQLLLSGIVRVNEI